MSRDSFYLKVAHALSVCQLVEEGLKLYITEALDLVRKCIDGKMVFRMKGEDFANAPLERLINMFTTLTDNKQLVQDLNRFKDERNFLSHQGITSCLDWEGGLFDSKVSEYQVRLDAIQQEGERLRKEIHLEANKFIGDLYFDEVKDGS